MLAALAIAFGTIIAVVTLAIAAKGLDDWLQARSRVKRRLGE